MVAGAGLATLWLNGNLPPELGTDPEEITRRIARYLTGPASPVASPERLQKGNQPGG